MNGAQLYDLLFPVVTRESAWRPRLISQLVAGLPVTTTPPGEASSSGPVILDVGAGTGTQALAIADAAPHARVIAVEPGSNVHAARQKPNPHGVEFLQGEAQALPLAAGSVDRVVISLALHHMSAPVRREALAEFRRVLKPDGRLHVVEFGKPSDPFMRAASAFARQIIKHLLAREDVAAIETKDWDEIDKAFGQLQLELDETINSTMTKTQKKVLENLDEEVHQRLKLRETEAMAIRSSQERSLYYLSKHLLGGDGLWDSHHHLPGIFPPGSRGR